MDWHEGAPVLLTFDEAVILVGCGDPPDPLSEHAIWAKGVERCEPVPPPPPSTLDDPLQILESSLSRRHDEDPHSSSAVAFLELARVDVGVEGANLAREVPSPPPFRLADHCSSVGFDEEVRDVSSYVHAAVAVRHDRHLQGASLRPLHSHVVLGVPALERAVVDPVREHVAVCGGTDGHRYADLVRCQRMFDEGVADVVHLRLPVEVFSLFGQETRSSMVEEVDQGAPPFRQPLRELVSVQVASMEELLKTALASGVDLAVRP